MSSSLKNTKWLIRSENTGSMGHLNFADDSTGSYQPAGGVSSPIVWAEAWNGDNCALWVVFKDIVGRNCVRIWGIEMTMQGGSGMGAFGNASPTSPNDTGYVADNLTVSPA